MAGQADGSFGGSTGVLARWGGGREGFCPRETLAARTATP